MTVTKHQTTTKTTTLQSTEGLNLDVWQSFDLKNFLPKALQELIDEITKLLDKVQAVLEFALAAAKKAQQAVSVLFDFLRSILNAIRDAIFAMLDLFPLLETGIYFLYIPIGTGGNNYYLKTFKDSLTDLNDRRKPPTDDRLTMHGMFFMAGATWIDQNKLNSLKNMWQNVATIKKLFTTGDTTNSIGINPPRILSFNIEKGNFSSEVTTSTTVTNSIPIPAQNIGVLNEEVASANKYIRTSIEKLDTVIPSSRAGDAYNLTWRLPPSFKRPFYTREAYSTNHSADKYRYEFIRTTTKIHGVYILRATTRDTLQAAIDDFPKTQFKDIKNFPKDTQHTTVTTTVGSADLITYPLTVKDQLTSTQWYIDSPTDATTTKYYYSIAIAYSSHNQMRAAIPDGNGKYKVQDFYQLNTQTAVQMNSVNNSDEIISVIDFSKVAPQAVKYKDIESENLEEALVIAGEFTRPRRQSANTLSVSSRQPNWVSFALFRDLFPQVKQMIERVKAMVNNIVDGVLEDLEAFERYVKAQIAKIERTIEEALDFIRSLRSLLFPPMAGIHYFQAESKQGTSGLTSRLEKSLEYALLSSENTYHPALLDVDYQSENPEEYYRRKNIPAYNVNDLTTGFVLLFQEPQLKRFFQDLWNIPTKGLMDQFQQIYDESTKNFSEIVKMPEMKYPVLVKHEAVAYPQQSSNPSEYMNSLSKHKLGTDIEDEPVNNEGNVEQKATNTGPYTFPTPTSISIALEEDIYTSITIPAGILTNEQIVSIINSATATTTTATTATPTIAFTTTDGALMLEAKHLQISPCSAEAAAILGLPAPLNKSAPETPIFTTEQFEYSAGDYIVELQTEGPPTVDMLTSTPPILQLFPADLNNSSNSSNKHKLGPDACYIKIQVETDNSPVIVDVTGNQGNNPQNKSAYWELTATYPLNVTTANNKLDIQLTTTQGIKTKYNTFSEWNTELQKLKTELEGRTHTPVNFTETLSKPTPVTDSKYTIAIQAGTYQTPQELMAAILSTLHGSPELDENNNQIMPRIYPAGLLATEVDADPISSTNTTKTFKSRLLFEDIEAHNSSNSIAVTQATTSPIHTLIDQPGTTNIAGITKVDYTLTQIVNNLNAAIPSTVHNHKYFDSSSNNTLRITGSKVGQGNIIKVFSSVTEIEGGPNSKHYHKVASAIFGVSQQQYDLEVEGIGDPLTTRLYALELENKQYSCINFSKNSINCYNVDLSNVLEYNVEIENSSRMDLSVEIYT